MGRRLEVVSKIRRAVQMFGNFVPFLFFLCIEAFYMIWTSSSIFFDSRLDHSRFVQFAPLVVALFAFGSCKIGVTALKGRWVT